MEQKEHESDDCELLIEPRPMIQVFLNKAGTVTVSVTSIHESLDRVEADSIALPLECCEEVGNALIKLANTR